MARKNVSATVSGAGLIASVWTALDKAVRQRGGGDEDLHRLATPEGETLIGWFADKLVGAKQAIGSIFKATVDYSRSLAEMIAAGKYGWVNSDITQEHFPLPSIPAGLPTKVEFNLELVHFNRVISSDEALAELKKMGLRPATLPELLAFGEKYPEEQRKYPIVALGSVWRCRFGRYVPYLWSGADGRYLGLDWFGYEWNEDCRFLVVREV